MTIKFRTLLVLEVIASVILFLLSTHPGLPGDVFVLVMLTAFVWLPAGIIAAVVSVIVVRRRRLPILWPSGRQWLALVVVAIVTIAGLWGDLPLRATFFVVRASFDRAVPGTPVSQHGVPFGRRVGVYHVDERATDPRGGTFFRVYEGGDGLSPDIMSYGFVKLPNHDGTPFGAARYEVHPLTRDWYWFQASDDWF